MSEQRMVTSKGRPRPAALVRAERARESARNELQQRWAKLAATEADGGLVDASKALGLRSEIRLLQVRLRQAQSEVVEVVSSLRRHGGLDVDED
jgi:hypothetical protein